MNMFKFETEPKFK